MSDRTEAIDLAKRIMAESDMEDLDSDMVLLSRQFLRAIETIESMHKQLQEVDWEGKATEDLVNANRDEILKKHQEAISLIRKITAEYVKPFYTDGMGAVHTKQVWEIIKVLNLFHPMHSESWSGFPQV